MTVRRQVRDLSSYTFSQDDITHVLQDEADSRSRGGRLIAPSGSFSIGGELPRGGIVYDFTPTRLRTNAEGEVGLAFSGAEVTILALEVMEEARTDVLVRVTADGATIVGARLGRPEKDTRDLMVYNEAALWVEGDEVKLSGLECFNHAIGLRLHGRRHILEDSRFRDNICGLYLSPTCRDVEVTGCHIHHNNVNHRSGAGGVLVHRNVSRLELHNCDISHSGEHGIYLQGDHCRVHNNRVWSNYAGGIKTGAYPTGLFWYDDEEATQEYWQTDNVIHNNVCWNNAWGRENSADIYVQSGQYLDESRQAHVKDWKIKQNRCNDSGNGIKIVYLLNQRQDTELSAIRVSKNTCHGAKHDDIAVHGSRDMEVVGNHADRMYVAGGRRERIIRPAIEKNDVRVLRLSNMREGRVAGNSIRTDFSISGSVFRLSLVNNRRIVATGLLNLAGIEVISGNELIRLTRGGYFGSEVRRVAVREFSFNRVVREERGGDSWYCWSTPLGVDYSMQMIGNVWELAPGSRGVRIHGGMEHMVQSNKFLGTEEVVLDIFCVESSVAGNTCQEGGVLRLRPQSARNEIYGNSGFRLFDESGGANRLYRNEFV